MKQAIFLIVDNGCDGRNKTSIIHAFTDETVRDDALKNHPNKAYYRSEDCVVDLTEHAKTALMKLDGLDKLALGIENTPKTNKVLIKPIPRRKECRECHAKIGTMHSRSCSIVDYGGSHVVEQHCITVPI
jgi:hypothetical protein